MKPNKELIFVTTPQGSQSELELFELFGQDFGIRFKSLDFTGDNEEIGPIKRFVLEELGIEIKDNFGANYLRDIESQFGTLSFPTTREFSHMAMHHEGEHNDLDS